MNVEDHRKIQVIGRKPYPLYHPQRGNPENTEISVQTQEEFPYSYEIPRPQFAGCTTRLWHSEHEAMVAAASLPMVCPFAIGKAFGLAAATRREHLLSS